MVPGKKYTPEDFLLVAWRRRWLIVLPFVVVLTGTVLYARSLPNLYKAETLILVVPQRVPQSYVASTVTIQIDQRLHAISQQVQSRSRLERLIEEFDLYPEQRKKGLMDDVIQRMSNDIKIEITKTAPSSQSGTALRVGYVSKNPLNAMRVAERLTTLFTDANLRDRELLAEGTDQFIEAELIAARRRLEEHERELEEFRRMYPWEQPEEYANNRWAYVNAQQALMNHLNGLNQARERLLFLERMVADLSTPPSEAALVSPAAGPTTAPQSAAAQLEAARTALRSLELRLKPDHPDVVNQRRVIAELARKAEQEALAAPVSAESSVPLNVPPMQHGRLLNIRDEMDTLKRKVAAGEAEEARLREILAKMGKRVENLPLRVRELAALTRDFEAIRAHYHDLLRKKDSATVALNLERQQIGEQMRIIEPARLPTRPFSPDRGRLNLLGGVMGLALGLGLVALLEYRDTSLRSHDDVLAALSLPVLALVPVMRTTIEIRRSRRRKLMWSAAGVATLVICFVATFFWTLQS